ncbi:MAG: epoxyqueuosine reductase QueH [Armatimonadota bacterium]|nr:epoxyqueuosine reductase QueH [Armatimonadota bacterium]
MSEARAEQRDESGRPPLALHVCCGPCATAVIERLREEWDVRAVWHNPNIQPREEYLKRLESMRRVAELSDVPLAELERDVEAWREACRGLMDEPEGGARCDVCFRMRLERTARWAAERGIDVITTTLTVSPHTPAERVNAIGEEVACEHGLRFLAENFKKRHGFQRSVELSKRWGLYRQTWCGCLPSRDESRGA